MDGVELAAMALALIGTGAAANIVAALWTLSRRKRLQKKERAHATEMQGHENPSSSIVRVTVEHPDGHREEVEVHDRESLDALLDEIHAREQGSLDDTRPVLWKRRDSEER